VLPGAAAKPILLGPGEHRITAHTDGYASAEKRVEGVSGRDQPLALALVADPATDDPASRCTSATAATC
jgi:hypothetical protein